MQIRATDHLALILVACTAAGIASAQTTVMTGSGSSGSVPVFTLGADVENSIISQPDSSAININGNFGVGIITASQQVLSEGTGAGFRVQGSTGDSNNGAPWYGLGMSNTNLWPGGQNAVQLAGYFGLSLQIGNGSMVIRGDNGNVGIGTTSPGAKFEVNGSIALTSGSGTSIPYADGTTQSTAWIGTTCGGDYAESVDVAGDRTRYGPGDLLVIDPQDEGRFLKSARLYSTLVTGMTQMTQTPKTPLAVGTKIRGASLRPNRIPKWTDQRGQVNSAHDRPIVHPVKSRVTSRANPVPLLIFHKFSLTL